MSLPFHRLESVDVERSVLRAKDIIVQLGTAIGIPELCLEDNACILSIDGLPVTLEFDAQHYRFVASCFIAEAPESDGGQRLRSLLEGNLMGVIDGTRMVFAIDPQGRIVMACSIFMYDLHGTDLADAVAEFVAYAEAWRERMNEQVVQPATEIPPLLAPAWLA